LVCTKYSSKSKTCAAWRTIIDNLCHVLAIVR
jgi:hypothetical protein